MSTVVSSSNFPDLRDALEGLPPNLIVLERTGSRWTTTIELPQQVSPHFFASFTNQVLKNPTLGNMFPNDSVFHIRGGGGGGGGFRQPTLNTTISTSDGPNEEIKEFFQILGQRYSNSWTHLELERLQLPLSLLNTLLHHIPQNLKNIRLRTVQFLPEENENSLQLASTDFVSILKRLPDLDAFANYYANNNNNNNNWCHTINKLVGLELVKSSTVFENLTRMRIQRDSMVITVDDYQLGGRIELYTDRMLLAIEAIQNNDRLQILAIPLLDIPYELLQETVAPVFAQALTNPNCNVLERLVIGTSNFHDAYNTEATSGPVLLSEIGNVLSQLKVRKLFVRGPENEKNFHQQLIQNEIITMERLNDNHWLEVMEVAVYKEERGILGRRYFRPQQIQFSNRHKLHLKVNTFHNQGQFGTPRIEFIANPENVSPEKWLGLFQALLADGDLDIIYYYYHIYTTKADTANQEDYHRLGKSNKKICSPPESKKARIE